MVGAMRSAVKQANQLWNPMLLFNTQVGGSAGAVISGGAATSGEAGEGAEAGEGILGRATGRLGATGERLQGRARALSTTPTTWISMALPRAQQKPAGMLQLARGRSQMLTSAGCSWLEASCKSDDVRLCAAAEL